MAPVSEADAIALFQSGRFAEAESAFRAIVEKHPRHANGLHALGLIALQSHRLDDAIGYLQRAARADPGAFSILHNLGTALRQGGRLDEAVTAFRRAISLNPRSAEAHLGLGNTMREKGDREAARENFLAALRVDPRLAGAHYNLALVEIDSGDASAAEKSLRRVLEIDARHAEAWNHLGLIAHRAERIDEALAHYARAVDSHPGFAPALVNWGNALKDRGDLEGALGRYEAAAAADPTQARAMVNRASVLLERGDRAGARTTLEHALEASPDLADARYALGLVDLFDHEFGRGWAGYEFRFDTRPPVAAIAPPRLRPLAALEGAKRVAIRKEQGLGDQVLFSTLLPELARSGVSGVVEIDSRLAAIYRSSLPDFEFASDPKALASCGHEIAIGSLPAFLRRGLEDFERQPRALLVSDLRRVMAVKEFLPDRPVVGISWRSFQGFGRRHIGERKSIPLEAFAAFEKTGARLLDLQYGDVDAERCAFDAAHPGLRIQVPGLDLKDDIEGVLAAIDACDLVVTASNVTAHLAGAIGKRTWLVYLAANPPFHYWAPRSDGRSLWYPSIEIKTDAAWKRWDDALASVAEYACSSLRR